VGKKSRDGAILDEIVDKMYSPRAYVQSTAKIDIDL
jgi:hypothetical protein